jgi:hypothetical protein
LGPQVRQMALDVAIEPMTDWKKEAEKYRAAAIQFAREVLLVRAGQHEWNGWVRPRGAGEEAAAAFLVAHGEAVQGMVSGVFALKCRDCG